MNKRRTLILACTLTLLAGTGRVLSQAPAAAGEAALREALREYEQTWNRHDVKAWAAMMTADVWFTEASDFYERMKGRDKVVPLFEYNVKNSDIKWEILRVRMMPDGTATVALRNVTSILPVTNGKYAAVFDSNPSASRWRVEDGRWKMFFFTSDKGWARDVIKKDGLE